MNIMKKDDCMCSEIRKFMVRDPRNKYLLTGHVHLYGDVALIRYAMYEQLLGQDKTTTRSVGSFKSEPISLQIDGCTMYLTGNEE